MSVRDIEFASEKLEEQITEVSKTFSSTAWHLDRNVKVRLDAAAERAHDALLDLAIYNESPLALRRWRRAHAEHEKMLAVYASYVHLIERARSTVRALVAERQGSPSKGKIA